MWLILILALGGTSFAAEAPVAAAPAKSRGFAYSNDRATEPPLSIHILRIDRSNSELEFHTLLGGGSKIGLSTMSEQLKTLRASAGKPMAAINGDFWKDGRTYEGDPTGLQIMEGELVSAPSDRPCFWIDTDRQLRITNVVPQFKVRWPNSETFLVGLNEERTNNGSVLYTDAVGTSTRTKKGRELILRPAEGSEWLPLRSGQTLTARVQEVREGGDTLLAPDTVVLSLSPQLATRLTRILPGDVLQISTDTTPSLRGVQTAIGGGPTLLRQGKLVPISSSQVRHPRTAIGWNATNFFFLVVDGRQPTLSVGMTLAELANYMQKLGCQEALNLDGGGSSTIWIYGQVMNSPCYGHERPMANALVLTRKTKTRSEPRREGNPDSP